MDQVLPLAHTKPDWKIFNQVSKECMGQEPTRSLDANHMSPDTFSSFVSTLDLYNANPLQNLRQGYWTNRTWDHVSMSFLYTLESDTIVELASHTDLKILSFPMRKNNFSIITGSLADWYIACIRFCNPDSPDSFVETRDFITQCFNWLEDLGYKEIFTDFNISMNTDNTLILRKK